MEGEVGGGTTEQYDDQLAEKEEHVCHAEKDVGEKKFRQSLCFLVPTICCEMRKPNTNKFQRLQPVKDDNAEQVPHDELERGSGGGAEVEALYSINQ